MEGYIKEISFLGENIQTIRKHRGMKQQELAAKSVSICRAFPRLNVV